MRRSVMRFTLLGLSVGLMTASAFRGAARANFLHITVRSTQSDSVRIIWRPYAGALGPDAKEQQRRLINRQSITHPDSIRRWRDSTVRDTLRVATPAEMTVDMTGGPVVIETLTMGLVRVETQLTPERGPIVGVWGRAFRIDSDGLKPTIEQRR